MTKAVSYSVSIGVGGCLWPSPSSVVHSGIMVGSLWKNTPILSSRDNSMT